MDELEALALLVAIVKRAGIDVVDYQPAEVRDSLGVVHTVGGTPTEYQFRVTVYVQGGHPETNQLRLHDVRVAVENELRADVESRFGPSQWSYDWIDGTDVWMVTFELTCGREDF